MHTLKQIIYLSLLLAASTSIIGVYAATEDAEQPLHVEAGQFEAYKAENISVFRQDVLITKGSIKIKADEARLKVVDGEVMEATILGNPVEFEQVSNDGELVQGWAERVEYDAENNFVDLTGSARLYQGDDLFESETIHYDTLKQSVRAQSQETSNERVQITFMPRNTKKQTSEKQQAEISDDDVDENVEQTPTDGL